MAGDVNRSTADAAPSVVRPLSMEKKLWPPISSSIVCTMNSASARSVGATWMVMRSSMSRTISGPGDSSEAEAMTCVEAETTIPLER